MTISNPVWSKYTKLNYFEQKSKILSNKSCITFFIDRLSVDAVDLSLVAVREDGHDDHVGLRMVLLSKGCRDFADFICFKVRLNGDLKQMFFWSIGMSSFIIYIDKKNSHSRSFKWSSQLRSTYQMNKLTEQKIANRIQPEREKSH